MKPLIAMMFLCLMSACSSSNTPRLRSDIALNDANGVMHHPLADNADSLAVFVFVTIDCPISNSYAPELNRIAQHCESRKVKFNLVQVDRGITRQQAIDHGEEYGFRCTILMDTDHALAKSLSATVTPEAALVRTGRQPKLLYLGRVDDQYVDFGKKRFAPSQHDLLDAIDAALRGQTGSNPRTRAVGCPIPEQT